MELEESEGEKESLMCMEAKSRETPASIVSHINTAGMPMLFLFDHNKKEEI